MARAPPAPCSRPYCWPPATRWAPIRRPILSISMSGSGSMAIGAVLIGLGYGPITPASSHLLARSTPAHRMSFVFSVKQTGVPLGGVLAGMLVPGLAGLIGWQGAFLIIATITLLCAVAIQPLCAELDAAKDNTQALSFEIGRASRRERECQ